MSSLIMRGAWPVVFNKATYKSYFLETQQEMLCVFVVDHTCPVARSEVTLQPQSPDMWLITRLDDIAVPGTHTALKALSAITPGLRGSPRPSAAGPCVALCLRPQCFHWPIEGLATCSQEPLVRGGGIRNSNCWPWLRTAVRRRLLSRLQWQQGKVCLKAQRTGLAGRHCISGFITVTITTFDWLNTLTD